MRSHTAYPVENMSSSSRPTSLACNYIQFVNSGQTGDLHIIFDGQNGQIWYLQIIKAFANNNHIYDVAELDYQNNGEYTVEAFEQYQWVAVVTDLIQGSNGDYTYSAHITQTAVDENNSVTPIELSLLGNYPNPFNSRTVISLYSPSQEIADIAVYDIQGRKLSEKKAVLNIGENSIPVEFDSDDSNMISSGIFYYTVSVADRKLTGRMLYLK
jgi:hypothetical protein